MTIEEIRQMPAGAQIDWLIATEIFNARKPSPEQIEMIKVIAFQFGNWSGEGDRFAETVLIAPLPHKNHYTGADFHFIQPYRYSTDIAAAWQIVEKMRADGYNGGLRWTSDGYEVIAAKPLDHESFTQAVADTAPLAICRAALIAKLEAR
jgi:hypothetical protein